MVVWLVGMFVAGRVALSPSCRRRSGNFTGITKPSLFLPHTGDADSMEHAVIACQENRSFDAYVGQYTKAGKYAMRADRAQSDGKGGQVKPSYFPKYVWDIIHCEYHASQQKPEN